MTANVFASLGYADPMAGTPPWYGATPQVLTALADELRGHVISGFHLYEVQVRGDFGMDFEPLVRVLLLTDDPADGAPSWPLDEIVALNGEVRRRAWALGIIEDLYIDQVGPSGGVEDGFSAEAVARARSSVQ